MKTKASWAWVVVVPLVVLIAYLASTNPAVVSGEEKLAGKATKWEYKVYSLQIDDVLSGLGGKLNKAEAAFNALGEEGWELACEASPQFIFKRPKR